MEIILIVIVWALLSVGAYYLARHWWTRDFDWTVADSIFFGFLSLLGPVTFVAALMFNISAFIGSKTDTKRVIKEKRK